jgi:hypothetical protein
MKKKIYATQLTYEVPSIEKDQASKTILNLDYLLKSLRKCSEYMDLIYVPFKNQQNIDPSEIFKSRSALRRFRDNTLEKFNDFKKQAFRCFILFRPFSFDTTVIKLSRAFVLSITDLEKQVNRLAELFDNLESNDFSTILVKSIDNIKKEIAELEQLIEDRIKDHFEKNILARSWVDNVSEKLQEKIEKRIPSSIKLVEEREKQMNEEKEDKK